LGFVPNVIKELLYLEIIRLLKGTIFETRPVIVEYDLNLNGNMLKEAA